MIVPIFIPNQGCGHRCVFCEQESITSQAGFKVGKDHVRKIVEQALASPSFSRSATNEVAFYGGTFTCLPVPLIEELLGAVAPYLERGLFSGIRISTRPDSVDVQVRSACKRRGQDRGARRPVHERQGPCSQRTGPQCL